MNDPLAKATFSIEQDGEEFDVDVLRETIEKATGTQHLDAELVAEWLQTNLDTLSGIAHRKLDEAGMPDAPVVITADDWPDA